MVFVSQTEIEFYFKFVLISILFQVQLRSEGGVQGLYSREKAQSQAPRSRQVRQARQPRQGQPAKRCLLKRDRWIQRIQAWSQVHNKSFLTNRMIYDICLLSTNIHAIASTGKAFLILLPGPANRQNWQKSEKSW